MSKREWANLDCLTYLFNAFAVYTDADLSEDEKRVISNEVKKYVNDPDDGYASLNKTLGWFNEDIGKDIDEKKIGTKDSVVLNQFFGISNHMKEAFPLDVLQSIHDDLVRIGKADGHYDEVEQFWASSFAELTGCKH